MNKLIVANWKLHPSSLRETIKLARASDKKHVVICPPFPFLMPVRKILKRAALGAQDVFWEGKGPHTGEVGAQMLRSIGVQYVIAGHSERRKMEDTNEIVSAKVAAALVAGLNVIFCVGEPFAVRKRGILAAKAFVKQQLIKGLKTARAYRADLSRVIVAYEPVWAIGTGKSDKPEETKKIVAHIKKSLSSRSSRHITKVLYGGSVNAKNIKRFLRVSDGALVGGASLKPKEFIAIVRAVG